MTELQFDRVFSKAQDLQTERLTQAEVLAAEKSLRGFEQEGAKKTATIKQAAYILNLIAMDITGDYCEVVLLDIREKYLKNVTIKTGVSKKVKTKKK